MWFVLGLVGGFGLVMLFLRIMHHRFKHKNPTVCVEINTDFLPHLKPYQTCQVCGKLNHISYVVDTELLNAVVEKCALTKDEPVCLNCFLQACDRLDLAEAVAHQLSMTSAVFYKSRGLDAAPIKLLRASKAK